MKKTIYLNNAATSYPKPQCVIDAINEAMKSPTFSASRGSGEDEDVADVCRKNIAKLFNTKPENIALLYNASMALNMILLGTLKKGEHLIITQMEHNSILRPAKMLEERGVEITILPANKYGEIDIKDIEKSIKDNTKMLAMYHAANTTGTISDVERIGELCRKHGILFTLDAAQSAGAIPIDVEKYNIDFVAFTGHKALLGPQGTGGMYVRNKDVIDTIIEGGSGGWSDMPHQPDIMPVKFEVGTPNMPGFAGLSAGVEWVMEKGVENIHKREKELIDILQKEIEGIDELHVLGPRAYGNNETSGVLSMVSDRFSPSDISFILSKSYGIIVRDGLLCSPLAHKAIGTYPEGVLRVSVGPLTDENDIESVVKALKEMHS